jgi:integration host factor subunit beta
VLNRSDLIARLAKLHPQLLANDVTLAVKVILGSISTTLLQGGRVEIRGFGSFGLNYRPPAHKRNPKTGEKVDVPAKYMPHFKPGKELRWRVNRSASKKI